MIGLFLFRDSSFVIPAKAGIRFRLYLKRTGLDTGVGSTGSPTAAGMTFCGLSFRNL
jgi:hypothetical protein